MAEVIFTIDGDGMIYIQEIKRGFEKLLFLYSEKFTQNAIMVLWNIRLKIIYFLEREKMENLFGRD